MNNSSYIEEISWRSVEEKFEYILSWVILISHERVARYKTLVDIDGSSRSDETVKTLCV